MGDPKAVFVSSKSERCPRFSPDGKRIAFESNRGGTDEIWVCLKDGSNCQAITSSGGPHIGTPVWSPDGEWIAFDGKVEGRTAIFVISAQGGKPRYLTVGAVPRWSADGKWIYYSKGRIFKTPQSGGEPVAVTKGAGQSSEESSTAGSILLVHLIGIAHFSAEFPSTAATSRRCWRRYRAGTLFPPNLAFGI